MTSPIDSVPFCCDADALIEFERARLIQDLNVFAGLHRIRIPVGVYHEVRAYKGVSTTLKNAVERWKDIGLVVDIDQNAAAKCLLPEIETRYGCRSAWAMSHTADSGGAKPAAMPLTEKLWRLRRRTAGQLSPTMSPCTEHAIKRISLVIAGSTSLDSLETTLGLWGRRCDDPNAGAEYPALLGDPPKPKLVVQTRSPDVVRDCDLLRRIKANGGRSQVNMTVTTDDEEVRRVFEPSCPSNAARLRAVARVQAEGVAACVTMTPLLWVSDADAFAERLLSTGVRKFIVQPFHFQRGKFVASTREKAVDLMARKLGCDRAVFRERYLARYNEVYAVLEVRLTAEGAELGVGKDGFKPPF